MRKDIVGYEGLYQVDEKGNVWSLNYNRTGKEQILKPVKDKDGYLIVALFKIGKEKKVKVHRLVAVSFIPNYENRPQVNHKNGDKTDNRPENLEWCTASENIFHAYKTGLKAKGEKHHRAKHPDSVIRKAHELNSQGKTQREIGKILGYCQPHVSDILRGKKRKLSQTKNEGLSL